MIRYKNAKKENKPMLIEMKLSTIIPYIKDDKQKLKIIAYVNNLISSNYQDFTLIYSYFKLVGIYLIKDKELDTLYIEEKYRNKGIGSKVIKDLKEKIERIKVRKENNKAISFYEKNGFNQKEIKEDYIILRKDERNENKWIFKANSQWYQNNK